MHALKVVSAKALLLGAIAPTLLALPGLAQTFSNPYPRFADAADHWAAACIEGVGNEGLMKGYLDGRFLPDGRMTRAEFAAVMVKAFPNAPVVRAAPNFSDVAADFWGSDAIRAAYERGFLTGYPGNVFKPTQPITRAQAIVVMANAGRLTLAENGPDDSELVLRSFLRDWRQVPGWGSDAIAAAVQNGIVVNYPDANQLRPSANITRGEATALLCRANEAGTDARYYVPAQYVASFIDPPALTLLGEFPLEFSNIFLQRTVENGQMFFTGNNNGVAELWKTNGTVDGTQRIRALQTVQPNGERIQTIDATVYTTINAEETDAATTEPATELWTKLWIVTRQAFQQPNQPGSILAGIWHSDGTAQGTVAVASLSEALARSLQNAEYWMIEAGIPASEGKTAFTIRRPDSTELWIIDGKTGAGTQRLLAVPDVYSGGQRSGFGPSNFTAIGSYLFFITSSGEATTLWRTDGTVEGTEQLKTIAGSVSSLQREKDRVYFRWQPSESVGESEGALWVSDGTEAGTTALKDFFPGPDRSAATVLSSIGETVFILANSSAGTGLWATNGTPESTRLVKQIDSVPTHSGDGIFAQHDGKLFFAVPSSLPPSAPATSIERQIYEPTFDLWVTDGTAAGTTRLGTPIKSYFTNFTPFNNRLFFNGYGPDGQELWVTDGTVEGTHQVIDLAAGASPYSPNCPTQFPPTDWRDKQARSKQARSKQTESGPAFACLFYRVANSATPRSLTVRGDFLYFIAGDRDLYRTDGTALGTQFIQRLRGEDDDYSPEITPLGDRLLVTGYSNSNNRPQLWAVPEQEIPVMTGYP